MSLGWQDICVLSSVRTKPLITVSSPRKDETMGDKGGKKDKDKSKKQKADKQQQKAKAGQDKNRPKA
jgi:hypothetical protein